MLGFLTLGVFSNNFVLFIIAGALIGLGLSALLGAPLRYIMLNESRADERSVAQGVVAIFTSTGQLLGAALTGAIAASRALTTGLAAGYSLAFLITGLISLLLIAVAFRLKHRAAEQATIKQNEITAKTDQTA